MICIGCQAPREIDQAKCKPGEIHYLRCACGAIGILREDDRYQEIHRKKTFRESYERSKTRGGRLPGGHNAN